MVPVGVTGLFAVYHNIFARKVMLLPVTMPAGNRQPAGINMTASVIPVNEEVTLAQARNGKHVPRLSFDVDPGAVGQSGV